MKTAKKIISIVLMLCLTVSLLGCHSREEPEIEEGYIYLPTEVITEVNVYGSKDKEFKDTYEYDENGSIVKREYYIKRSLFCFNYHVRDICMDMTYTYDNQGKAMSEAIKEEHFTTSITDGSFVSTREYKNTYDNQGRLIKKEIVPVKGAHYGAIAYNYKYDSQGCCVGITAIDDEGTEIPAEEMYYDSNGNIIKKYSRPYYSYEAYGVALPITEKKEYSYDEQGRLKNTKTYHNFSSSEKSSDCFENNYYYDEYNRLIKREKGADTLCEYKKFVKVPLNDNSKKSFYRIYTDFEYIYY